MSTEPVLLPALERVQLTPVKKKVRDKNQAKRYNVFVACRNYLLARRFAEAESYATARGFTTDEVRASTRKKLPLPPKDGLGSFPDKPVPASVPEQAPVAAAGLMKNGWPVETEAEIWRGCRNKRLVIIQLPDGREASMWRGRRQNWRLGSKIRVVLESAEGDPYYYEKELEHG